MAKKARKFAPPKSSKEVEQARKETIPKKTLIDIKCCMGIRNDCRLIYYGIPIPEIETLSSTEIADYLCKFVLKIRKKNGDEFPPNSLHHILCGIQRYLRINGKPSIDFFKDPALLTSRCRDETTAKTRTRIEEETS